MYRTSTDRVLLLPVLTQVKAKHTTFSLKFSHDLSPLRGLQEMSFLGNTSSDDDDDDDESIRTNVLDLFTPL